MTPKKKTNWLAEETQKLRKAASEAREAGLIPPKPIVPAGSPRMKAAEGRAEKNRLARELPPHMPRPAERDVPFDNQENLGEPQRQRALAKVRAEAEKRNGPRYQRNRGGK